MSDSLVIIPTYNEKENVEKMIRKVFSLSFPCHILIIDDGSPDGTASIVKKLTEEFAGKLFIEEKRLVITGNEVIIFMFSENPGLYFLF